MITQATDLVEGRKYSVRWKQQSGNYRWYIKEAVWTFVGPAYQWTQLVWSGRPVCGTQDMNTGYFLDATEVGEDIKCTLPRSLGPYKG